MKKIKIKDYIELEVREAKCDFCGEVSGCVKGKSTLVIPETRQITVRALKDTNYFGKLKKVYDYPDLQSSMFVGDYYKDDDREYDFIYKEGDLESKDLYEITGEIRESVDICKNCIKQLAKLV